MIRLLLQKAIEQNNAFMTKDMIELQIQMFFALGKITEQDVVELIELLRPTVVEVTEEEAMVE